MVQGLVRCDIMPSSREPFFYIANDCLSAAIHMDVFDADILVAPMTQASENLYVRRIRSH